jgi:hypothetical protein
MTDAVTLALLAAPAAQNRKAGPIGLLVVVLLGVATYFLIRSMLRHLRKVPASFDPVEEPNDAGTAGQRGTATTAADEPGGKPRDVP